MNAWTVHTNPTSRGRRGALWLWLHTQEQRCLNNTSHKAAFPLPSLPPQAMPTKAFMRLPDVPDHRSDLAGKIAWKFLSGFFSPCPDQLLDTFPHTAAEIVGFGRVQGEEWGGHQCPKKKGSQGCLNYPCHQRNAPRTTVPPAWSAKAQV